MGAFPLAEDPTQTNDRSAQEPERLRTMQELWMIEAVRVLPLNASQVAILTVERPGPAAGRNQFVSTQPMTSNESGVAPSIINRSYKITAEIEIPREGADGVLVTQGGQFSGYALYIKDGKPTFTMNLLDIKRPKWQAPDVLPAGNHTIVFDLKMDPRGMPIARGGTGTLSVNGRQVAQRSLLGETSMMPEAIKVMMEELAKKRDR